MRVLLRVLPIAVTIVLAGYWLGDPAARAHGHAPSARASQYGTTVPSQYGSDSAVAVEPGPFEPVPVDAAPTTGTAASTASSTSASASGSASAASSASASSSASPASEDQYEGEYPEEESPSEESPSEESPSEEPPIDPEDYPGFYFYGKYEDTYYYILKCRADCGIENPKHPLVFECRKEIERRFSESGEIVKEKTFVVCVHPRKYEWGEDFEEMPERWYGEPCEYEYIENGKLRGTLVCGPNPGAVGFDESAQDAQEVDDAMGPEGPHMGPKRENEAGPGSQAFENVLGAFLPGEASDVEDAGATEAGTTDGLVRPTRPLMRAGSEEGGNRGADSPTIGAAATAQEVSGMGYTDRVRATSDVDGVVEEGDESAGTVLTASVLADRLCGGPLEGRSEGHVSDSEEAESVSPTSMWQSPGEVGRQHEEGVREPSKPSKVVTRPGAAGEGSVSASDPAPARSLIAGETRDTEPDGRTWQSSYLIILAGTLFLGTTVVLRRRF